jgi:NADH-quinone oxidoreductase subunit J
MFTALSDATNYIYITTDIWVNVVTEINSCSVFGHVLYSYYLFFFLIAGLVLLLALLGAILLTHVPNKVKEQKNFHQISKNPKIHIIS